GPTQTMAPLPGSPALDRGNNSANLATDQRGLPRTVDLPLYANSTDGTDIGAVEIGLANPPQVPAVVLNNSSAQRSRVTSIDVRFDGVVALPSYAADAFRLTRQSDGAIIDLKATASGTTPTIVTLNFSGPLAEAGSLPDGRYTLTALAS